VPAASTTPARMRAASSSSASTPRPRPTDRPYGFFVMKGFAINDEDVVYVSNARAADPRKFLNLILSAAHPALTGIQLTR
jgi:hypothetical protein